MMDASESVLVRKLLLVPPGVTIGQALAARLSPDEITELLRRLDVRLLQMGMGDVKRTCVVGIVGAMLR